ncbi:MULTISPECIES: polysaccharide deacetylase family protein [Agrobacterium]|uniref:Chitooligosaccharide deacetylase n=1 Tax=Agrobacterium tumefaciens TaxID=358 RepID=A0AAW8LUK0_AGRTU|nr:MULTISPECIES: polysaccharide deacetylase family protein [Agrobacterium]MBP2565889.1 putative ATP-grasp superfamily ATP-dependent carboligase/peptidoglycan/xylan/chitin deacetylase (PgdA/CDA1 family) [Agrobacterium tumefaciens]MDR6702814.1 putative ATP-grasp superfamily ATP-dependent carboligase/peptidoglycan/xylan/chitin deacetylase (PgdA/CDA1 family) [Agrobacterium tumefaciens]TCV53823.1 putative ATP-grasp superfamily ATP-dependent carboligase [Agrobacterium tumefaciens]WHO23956.1 polysacch
MTIPGVVIVGGAHGTLALARSLGVLNVPVYYLTHDSPLPGWSRFVRETIRWAGPHDAGAIAFLRQMAEKHGLKGCLLVPSGDGEVQLISQHREELSALYKIVLPDWAALQWLCEKPLLYKRAAELGVSIPRTYALTSDADIDALDVMFPVILKPNMGGGDTTIARAKVIRADDRQALKTAFADASGEIGAGNVVVQELIPGGGESQFSYAALWLNGEPMAEFTARRARQYPVDFGYTSTRVEVVDNGQAIDAARKMLKSAGHSGLVEVEFKLDGRDGELKLLDVNPRPWSWFGLCSAAGVDLGALLWRVANDEQTGQPVSARQGVSWSYLVRDTVAAFTLARRGETRIGDYFASLGKIRSWASFALNDPLPGLIDLPLTVLRVIKKRILPGLASGQSKTGFLPPLKRLGKYGAIRAGLEVSSFPPVRSAFPSLAGRGVIFTLHHVRPGRAVSAFAPNVQLSVTPQFLEEAIQAALECGLVPVHLHDLPALLADNHEGRSFCAFTLDDGYRNNADHAAPIFRKYAVPYTIFITPGFVERTRSLWWETAAALTQKAASFEFDFGAGPEQVACANPSQKAEAFTRLEDFVQNFSEDEAVERIDRAARQHGVDPIAIVDELVMDTDELRTLSEDPLVHFGAHTMTHVNMRKVDAARLAYEIAESARRVEAYVGHRPRSFSYPYGWVRAVGEREAKAVQDAGFSAAVTTQAGVIGPHSLEKPTQLPRVSLNGRFQKKRFVKALISGLPFRFI